MDAEYPHRVQFQTFSNEPDGGGGFSQLWTTTLTFDGFLDTPTSREVFEAQQLNVTLDRNLYYPYRTDVNEKMRCLFENSGFTEVYEIVSRPQDQGGQREVMKLMLKLVLNG